MGAAVFCKNANGSYSLNEEYANYWKLLIDRKMVNQKTGKVIEQKAVLPIFDSDFILGNADKGVVGILDKALMDPAVEDAIAAENEVVEKLSGWQKDKNNADQKAIDELKRMRDIAAAVAVQKTVEAGGVKAQFSLDSSIEETRDLIAVHNLSGEQLANTIALGGFPMPSMDKEFDYSLQSLRERHKNGVMVPVLSLKVIDGIKGSSLQAEAIKRAQAAGRMGADKRTAYVEFGEEKTPVLVDYDSFKHGAGDKSDLYKAVCLHLPAIAKNAVAVNSIEGKSNHQYPATVYLALANIGTGKEGYEQVAVRMIVEQGHAKEIRLYAIRKEAKEAPDSSASVRTQTTPTNDTAHGSLKKKGASGKVSSRMISIDEFLNAVKNYSVGRSTLSKDISEKIGFNRDNDPKITPYLRYALDTDLLRETVTAIDTEALEKKLLSLNDVKNLKGMGIWLKEPSRIFDAIAGDDRELRNNLHEIFERPHSDATGRYAGNIRKMAARVEQIAVDAGAVTVDKKGRKTFHENVSAASHSEPSRSAKSYIRHVRPWQVSNAIPYRIRDIRLAGRCCNKSCYRQCQERQRQLLPERGVCELLEAAD